MRILGVIPARGGSKGVPGKNLKLLGGIPLIAWTILAARESHRLTRTVVSTDSSEIAGIACDFGSEAPFVRPLELATDSARSMPVIQHAMHWAENDEGNQLYDVVVMLQPTTPFRSGSDIDGALEQLAQDDASSTISVVDVEGHHPARMKYLRNGELIDPPFAEAYENQPRQELAPMYIRNGAIYATKREWIERDSFKGNCCKAWIMSAERSINIDTPLDFQYAEWIAANGIGGVRIPR